MSPLDYLVLFSSMLGIAAFGIWKTRGQKGLGAYLKGSGNAGWITIGISVMATQASAITFISTPGQGYEDGLGFVQNYFGMPLALILVAAVFLPTVGKYGYSTMFFLFAGCTVVYFITAAFFLPETKGKTLEEIEAYFEGK